MVFREGSNQRDGADRKKPAVRVKFLGSQSMVTCSSSRDVSHNMSMLFEVQNKKKACLVIFFLIVALYFYSYLSSTRGTLGIEMFMMIPGAIIFSYILLPFSFMVNIGFLTPDAHTSQSTTIAVIVYWAITLFLTSMYVYKRKSIHFVYIAIWLLFSFHGCVDNTYISDL